MIVGEDMAIRRFTPAAEELFNLIPGDVGRFIGQINPNLLFDDLQRLIRRTIDGLDKQEHEVQDRDGRWYVLRIHPYRTADNRIDGAVHHPVGPFHVALDGRVFETGGYPVVREDQRGPIDVDAASRHAAFRGRVVHRPDARSRWWIDGGYFSERRDNGTPLTFTDDSFATRTNNGHDHLEAAGRARLGTRTRFLEAGERLSWKAQGVPGPVGVNARETSLETLRSVFDARAAQGGMGGGRLDYQFSPQARLSVRGSRYDNMLPYDPRYTGGATRTMASAIGTHRRSEQLLLTFTQVIGSRATNVIKAGHDLFHWNQFAHVKNANALPGQTAGLGAPVITLRGFTLGQSHQLTPQDIGEQEYTVRDDFSMSYTKGGRHDLRTGAEYIYNFLFETVCNGCMGNYDLQGGAIPACITSNWAAVIPDVNDVATWRLDLLSPLARQYSRGIAMQNSPYSRPSGHWGFTEYAPRHEQAFYAQDDWQVSPRLTLNLGLRYDLSIDQYVNWVVYPPFLLEPRPQDTNNFGPRLGFAYSLNDRTVLRGGAGKYYAEVTSQLSFTLRTVQSISPQVLYDGRADFNSNPFNGPLPTYEEAVARSTERVLSYPAVVCPFW